MKLSDFMQLPDDIEWHFIGHLQSNKAKSLLGIVLSQFVPFFFFFYETGYCNLITLVLKDIIFSSKKYDNWIKCRIT